MIRARSRALASFIVLILAVAAVALLSQRATPSSQAERPVLLLLTSLPLVFDEDFSLDGGGSEALDALNKRYRVVPISRTDGAELAKGRLLLMAQPPAQAAENLVALDSWVRGGGRVLLLADPMLEWPSKRPLGDPLRPPLIFADTGLLAHWGLRLEGPDERGPRTGILGGFTVATVSPGRLIGDCDIGPDRLVARCNVGTGAATVVADADLLDVGELDGPADRNLDAILSELSALRH
ncbi:MAG TPA: hypothetical protein VM145_03340 [Sphingomicrobium sp.]|nr:hypothetical protein [Sphingomicrobium sp.]